MQTHARKICLFLYLATALLAVLYAVYLSLDVDNYFFYTEKHRATWEYSLGHVAVVCSIMLVEAAVAFLAVFALRPRWLWMRCSLGFLVLGLWAAWSATVVMHMPVYVIFHHLWVWMLIALLIVVAVGAVARQLYLRFRTKVANS